MNKLRVQVNANWTSSENITKRMLDQFYVGQDLSKIEFVHADADMIFYMGYENEIPTSRCKKRFLFSMEGTWSGNFPRNRTSTDVVAYVQRTEEMSSPINVVECPTYMFYGAGGEGWTYNESVNIPHVKTKGISSIVSTLSNGSGDQRCIYNKRRNLIIALLESSLNIDIFSWPRELYPNAKELPRKIDGVSPYKFSIGIENCSEKNYITEKFYDPIITNTVPIYFGASNVREIFPQKGYILIEDIDNIDQILKDLKTIEENIDDMYNEYLPGVLDIKEQFFFSSKFNILTKILELALYDE